MSNKSILDERTELLDFAGKEEGKDFIDVSNYRKTDGKRSTLGQLLAQNNCSHFTTPFGKVISMRTYSDFLTTPDYPLAFLDKLPNSKTDYKNISKKRLTLPNYYALLTLGMIYKVRSVKKLQAILRKNTLPFTALIKGKESELWGKRIIVNGVDKKLARYVSIIRYVEEIVKQDRLFDEAYIKEFIEKCKDNPDKDIFDGIPESKLVIQDIKEPLKIDVTNNPATPIEETTNTPELNKTEE